MLSIIVAMAKNRVIGAGGGIPWRLPGELKLFKSITMGHTIIMGRRTYESIGRLLPGRTTVIVTRQRDYHVAGAVVTHSLAEAIEAAAGNDEIFVIGGGELYRVALPLVDRIYLTTVDAEPAGDTYFPELNAGEWREVSVESFSPDDRNPCGYRFSILERER
jgi:dihydrofolate reductase